MDNSLNQSTYEKFKKDILTFGLKPGDTVSAAKIADRYSVSRTPAREALVRLEAEGLVDIIPQSKSVISRIDADKARQEWFIRRSLELSMVDTLFERITQSDIKKMQAYNSYMLELSKKQRTHENTYNYLMADNEFHAVTYRICGQVLSETVIKNTMAHYLRLRFLTELDEVYQGRTVHGHEELIELLNNSDSAGYKKALSVHLGHAMNDISEMERIFPDYFVKTSQD